MTQKTEAGLTYVVGEKDWRTKWQGQESDVHQVYFESREAVWCIVCVFYVCKLRVCGELSVMRVELEEGPSKNGRHLYSYNASCKCFTAVDRRRHAEL